MTTPDTARHVAHVMGMPVTLALRGRHAHDEVALAAWRRIVDSLHEVDRIFSTYRDDSEISRLRSGSLALADVSPLVAEVLRLAERARLESAGAFDVWLPGPDGVRSLDPSGLVKGWAIERAAGFLDDLTETDTCLSAGGDMVCRTRVAESSGWSIGIEDPSDPGRILAVLPLTDGAVATSGTAHRGQHLVDGRTGLTPTHVASVTVVTGSLTWADIDATSAYAHGADAVRWLTTRPDRTALVVWTDGTTTPVRTAPDRRAA